MVSVIIPNYNHAPYLQERIESVLNQTYTNFEIIILDDCSTDNSKGIIEQYRNHANVTIHYNTQNSGSTFKQWNKGVSLAKGDLIWIAESDDIAENNFLAEMVTAIEADEKIAVAYCQSYRMDMEGRVTGDWCAHTDDYQDANIFRNSFKMSGESFITTFLIYKNVIPNASGVLFRKQYYDAVMGTDEDIRYCSDWLTWLKMLVVGDVYFTPQVLNYFRYHEKSVIASSFQKEIFRKKYDILMRKRFNRFLNNFKNKDVLKLNSVFLKDEILSEAYFLRTNGKYYQAIMYYLQGYFTI
ncbi:MAG: glycosyltransferase [Niabella sp.]